MERRRFLAAAATGIAVGVAGCSGPEEENGDDGGGGYDFAEPTQEGRPEQAAGTR